MGTRIDGLSVVTGGWRSRHSALALGVEACRAALERCGLSPRDVGLLINAGLYRDDNLGEPALAPLIQEDIGANPEDPHPGGAGTFSFDVANGSCGLLNALEIADGFLRTTAVRTVLVVASDASPSRRLAPDFPYQPGGAAAVCRWAPGDNGLGPFRWHSSPDDGASFKATVGFEDNRNILRIAEEADFAERAADAAVAAAHGLLSGNRLDPADIGLVVASPSLHPLTKKVAAELDMQEEAIVTDPEAWHTAGLFAALGRAQDAGLLRSGTNVLLLCAAAGVKAGAALYRV
jgi:3-oxoacyl-[acyl-carrier-protein] synthase-3